MGSLGLVWRVHSRQWQWPQWGQLFAEGLPALRAQPAPAALPSSRLLSEEEQRGKVPAARASAAFVFLPGGFVQRTSCVPSATTGVSKVNVSLNYM